MNRNLLTVFFALTFLVFVASSCGSATEPDPTQISPTTAPTSAAEEAAEPTSPPEITEAEEATAAPEPDDPLTGGELVVGLSWEPSKIDPHRTAAENAILPIMQACETLVIPMADGSYAPGLATSWEISDDGTIYTFHLRDGVSFHDGTPFNAEAVKYNFDRLMDPETQSEEGIDHLGPYIETEVVDDMTAVVHLERSFAPLMNGVSSGWLCMVSPTAAEEWGPEEFQDHFVGTGPFVFKEWVRHEYIRLERNPDYWGGAEVFNHHGLAYLDAIVFKFLEEATVRSGVLETGEIQIAQEIPAADVDRLNALSDINVTIKPGPGTGVMLLLNMSKSPTDDLLVRQAINYAVDQVAIADILYQGKLAANFGALSPVTPCYWSGAEDMYAYDPEKAKTLLDEAGWIDTDGDGIRDKDGEAMVLDLPTHGDFPMYRDPCPIVQAQLLDVGIQVNVLNNAVPAWLEAGRTGNLHMGIVDWRTSDPDFDLRLPFHSDNATAFAWNWHSNEHLDELIIQGSVKTDLEERCEIYQEVQQIIMEDAMIKPLNIYAAIWGSRSNVKDLRFDDLSPSWFWAFDTYLAE